MVQHSIEPYGATGAKPWSASGGDGNWGILGGLFHPDNNANNEINLTSLFIINESIKILSHNSFTSGGKDNLTSAIYIIRFTKFMSNFNMLILVILLGQQLQLLICGTTMHQSSGWTYTYSVNSGQGISEFSKRIYSFVVR